MCKLITIFRQLEKLEVGIDKPNGRPISLISLLKVIPFYHSTDMACISTRGPKIIFTFYCVSYIRNPEVNTINI